MMRWLDNFPLWLLVLVAVFMALSPFVPEPHLWEKTRMLFSGTLTRPLDIFDLFMHGAPLVLLVIRLSRMAGRRRNGS